MSSNLKSYDGTENNVLVQFINALEYRVKILHPSVPKCVSLDSPSNSNLLAGELAWNSASIHPPQAKSETFKFLGLGAAGLPELPGLVWLRKPRKP